MEGKCYALIWGVMQFYQFLHQIFFSLKIDHKPLEWFTTISDVNMRQGRWISMLKDFHFKIIHRLGSKHSNVDALNMNLEFVSKEEDFLVQILDQGTTITKIIMETGDRCHDRIEIHEIQNIFTLSEIIKEGLKQPTKENS
jgi:hypothetical protein